MYRNNFKNDIKNIVLKHEEYQFAYSDLRDILEEISREICTEIINARPSKYTKRKK
jgi:hypothetical protein